MKWFLIILSIIVIAIFTGTWIFGGAAWLLNFLAGIFEFLEKVFNFFGWNNGLISSGVFGG